MVATEQAVTGRSPEVAVAYEQVSKDFGATRALRDASLELAAGQVHAFVGENGAGKSTCLGVLAGRIAASRGTIRVHGDELPGGDPRACRAAGVVSIYQELTIVPALSAQANVFLGLPLSRRGFLSERRMRVRYLELCEEVGVEPVADGVPAGHLSVAEQQLLEIMRALVADARLILLDEPTASLALHERDALLRLMDRLRTNGITLVFVSHNLDEVLQIADTITVFREGAIVASGSREEWDKGRVVREMLGAEAGGQLVRELARELLDEDGAAVEAARARRVPRRDGVPLVQVEGLAVPGAVEGVDFELHAGEILGLGGLVGSGRTTVLRALAGLEPRATGTMWVDGRRVGLPRSVRQAQRLGIALVPEDRKGQGLVLGMDAMNNVALGGLSSFARGTMLSRRRMAAATAAAAAGVGFRPERIGETARNLSGGNQQKLLLARWRLHRPRVLLADEPTRGIDIGAKAEIVGSLEEMAQDGLAIVVVSSELEEVCAISDRVVVLVEGRQVGVLDRVQTDVTPTTIMSVAFGLEQAATAT
jgi:ABC-type sugar transport system ATPase subunit